MLASSLAISHASVLASEASQRDVTGDAGGRAVDGIGDAQASAGPLLVAARAQARRPLTLPTDNDIRLSFTNPRGLWSDDTHIWVAGADSSKVYAYVAATGARDADQDFTTLVDAGHSEPSGLWSDGATMWISNSEDGNVGVYAYDLTTKARVPSKDFTTLDAAGNDAPRGLWSDGTTMWVADYDDVKLYAYSLADRTYTAGEDFDTLKSVQPRQDHSVGLWSDGTNMWVSDSLLNPAVLSYDLSTKERNEHLSIGWPRILVAKVSGIWSDGTTMRMIVNDARGTRIAEAPLPTGPGEPASISLQSTSDETLTIGWSAPTDIGSSAVTSYEVRYRRSGLIEWTTASRQDPLATTETIRGLSDYNSYEVQVRGVNFEAPGVWAGAEATPGPPVPAGAPGPVAALAATSGDGTLNVTWDPPTDIGTSAVTGYEIGHRAVSSFLDGDEATTQWQTATATATDRSTTLTGVFNLTRHEVRVRAVNSVGGGRWTGAPAGHLTLNDYLQEASGLWHNTDTMWVVGDDSPDILAFDMATGARNTAQDFTTLAAAGNHQPLEIHSDDTTMWVVDSEGKIYAYDMRTKANQADKTIDTEAAGNSDPWGLWTDGTRMFVTDQRDDKIYAYDIPMGRRDPAHDFDRVSDRLNNVWLRGLWSDGSTMWIANGRAFDRKPDIHAFDIRTWKRKSELDISLPRFATPSSTAPGITGLSSDGRRMWYIAGSIAQSQTDHLHSAPMRIPPARPEALSVQEADGQFIVMWEPPETLGSSDLAAYEVRWRDGAGDAAWSEVVRADPVAETETITGSNGTYYEVSVRATNALDSGPWRTAGATPVAATAPGRPTGLTADAVEGGLDVSWQAPGASVTGYEVRYRAGRAAWSSAMPSGLSATITGLNNGTRYEVQVRADDGPWASITRQAGQGLYNVYVLSIEDIWSDGTTMWVADSWTSVLYAYDLDRKQAVPEKNVDVLQLYGNDNPQGMWVDEVTGTWYVSDYLGIYRYDFHTGEYVDTWLSESELEAAGVESTYGLWSDRTTLWVADHETRWIRAFRFSDKSRDASKDLFVPASRAHPTGLWSDGTTMWVLDVNTRQIMAFDLRSRLQVLGKFISLPPQYVRLGIWSDGVTMWVTRTIPGSFVEAYRVPIPPHRPRSLAAGPSDAALAVTWMAPSDEGSSAIHRYDVRYNSADNPTWNNVDRDDGLALSETIDGLSNGTDYRVEVRAVNSEGGSPWQWVEETPSREPGRPRSLRAVPGDTQLTIGWGTADSGGNAITEYRIQYSPDSGSMLTTRTVGPSIRRSTITGLTNGTEYEVSVLASNDRGDGEASTVLATPSTTPGPPDLNAEPGDRSVVVTWEGADTGGGTINGYLVRRRVASPQGPWVDRTVDADVRSVTVTGLDNGTEYELWVLAKNDQGDSEAAKIRATPSTVPDPPTRLEVSPADGQFTVAWDQPPDGGSEILDYFVRYRVVDPQGAWTEHNEVRGLSKLLPEADDDPMTDDELVNGTEYLVEVKARNQNGHSDAVTARATPSTLPDQPSSLAAAPSDGTITATWDAPDDDGGSTVTRYEVQYRSGRAEEQDGPWRHATPSGPPWQAHLRSLSNGDSYTVRVRAVNANGAGPWAGTTATPIGVPGPLTSLAVRPTARSLIVEWDQPAPDSASPVTRYTVQYRPDDDVGYPPDHDSSWTDASSGLRSELLTQVTIGNLDDGTAYAVRVRAENTVHMGPWSNATATAGVLDGVSVQGTTVTEESGLAEFTVTLSGGGQRDGVSVDFETRDVTAVAGTDYVATRGQLVFNSGETVKTVNVPIIDDEQSESAETFTVNLVAVTDATINPDAESATVTIRDGDGRPGSTIVAPAGGGGGGGGGAPAQPEVVQAETPEAFADVDADSVHAAGVANLQSRGVLVGTECAETMFCPGEPILRWTMAVWLVRILDGEDPQARQAPRFEDVDAEAWWAAHVERLADLEVTLGCSSEPARYCPDDAVTRAQMASFLTRAFELEAAASAGFDDVEANAHEDNINALFAAGITVGCDTGSLSFCPRRSTTRAQMATFLSRALSAGS